MRIIISKNPYREVLEELKEKAIHHYKLNNKSSLGKVLNAMKVICDELDDRSYEAYQVFYEAI